MIAVIAIRVFAASLAISAVSIILPASAHDSSEARSQQVPIGVEIGGPFVLVNHLGGIATERDLLGKISIVYFGYTYCPDWAAAGSVDTRLS